MIKSIILLTLITYTDTSNATNLTLDENNYRLNIFKQCMMSDIAFEKSINNNFSINNTTEAWCIKLAKNKTESKFNSLKLERLK